MAIINIDRYNAMKRQADQSASRKNEADSYLRQQRSKLAQVKKEAAKLPAVDTNELQKKIEISNSRFDREVEALRKDFRESIARQSKEYSSYHRKSARRDSRGIDVGNRRLEARGERVVPCTD